MQFVILIKGHPGSGKSSVARDLSRRLKWPLIDKDDARNCFVAVQDQGHAIDWNNLSYAVMFEYVTTNVNLGLSVIIDCPLSRRELYQTAKTIADKANATIVLVECEAADVEVWQQRVVARACDDADARTKHKPQTWSDIEALLSRYGDCWRWSCDGSVDIPHRLVFDTTRDTASNIASRVIDYIQQLSKPADPAGQL